VSTVPATLRGSIGIAGVGEAELGEAAPGLTHLDVAASAASVALTDAGLAKQDVDAVFAASAYDSMSAMSLCEYLGIRARYTDSTNVGGSSFLAHLLHACAAISTGLCGTALIVYGSTQRSDRGRLVYSSRPLAYEEGYGAWFPVSMYALAAARHMHQYGTTREQLAEVAVAARQWAAMTPGAFARTPLTIEDVLTSRPVSTPLTARDCCLVTDGGAAVVVTSLERARDLRQPLVGVLGAAEASWHRHISQMPDLTVTAAQESGARAFAMAGVTPADVDVAALYDAFTINPILFLEDLGFCKKGEGGAFVADGGIAPGGRLPVNTNGGGLSYTHPGMYGLFAVIEAVRQLRGACGERQVAGASVALAHGNGGVLSSEVTAILGNRSALG
jgi:acetyl-CoA acetyltransferase